MQLDEPVNPQQLLNATVYSAQLQLDDVPILPRTAVLYDNGTPYVNLVQEGAVGKRIVLTGPNDGSSVMILAGLDPDEAVAVK